MTRGEGETEPARTRNLDGEEADEHEGVRVLVRVWRGLCDLTVQLVLARPETRDAVEKGHVAGRQSAIKIEEGRR